MASTGSVGDVSFGGRPNQAALLVFILVAASVPALAQADNVPQSLWGVRGDVGLGVMPQFVTNYGERSPLEQRPSGEGVRVAIIDTGIDPDHPDLDGALACDHCWRDFVNNRTEAYDDNGHGTHVAGIIAGNGHLQMNPLESYFPTGAIGLAAKATLVVAKAMNESGGGKDARVAEAIEWSLDPDGIPGSGDEPHILHLSLGVRPDSNGVPEASVPTGSKTEEVVRDAIEKGIFVVMSAGNQGQQGPAAPGNIDGVVAVGALSSRGQPLEMSNRGEGVDIFAPGVVMSTWPRDLDEDRINDGYTGLAGTSQAAPVVTGGLALAVQANPDLVQADATKVQHVEEMIRQTGGRSTDDARIVTFDGATFLESQDRGTDELHWGMVGILTLTGLLVILVLGRLGYVLVQDRAESDEGVGRPPEPEELPGQQDAGDETPQEPEAVDQQGGSQALDSKRSSGDSPQRAETGVEFFQPPDSGR